jgi:hypothetical protein
MHHQALVEFVEREAAAGALRGRPRHAKVKICW